jgi:serine protease Do
MKKQEEKQEQLQNSYSNATVTAEVPKDNTSFGGKSVSMIMLLSMVFGFLGAIIGNVFLQPLINQSPNTITGGIQNIQVNEDSAVVDVVKRASPAVVSIIISKDLNKVPGFSSNPFDFWQFGLDPFYQNRDQDEVNDSAPNIQPVGGGSGFVISSDGLIVTNKHVVEDESATYTVLTNDGKKHEAKVLSTDPINDLALLKIETSGLVTLPLGDSSKIKIGQKVIAIGNSLGQYRNTITTGVVSGIGRTITASGVSGAEQLEGVIQTDAAINPGNSGGPLLDIGGAVIGINTAIDSQGQLLGFAIPVNDLKKDIESFQKFGKITKPFLGIRYVLVNETIKEENKLTVDYGALIVSGGKPSAPAVIIGSAADKAGLREGDIILFVNDQIIDQDHSLAGLLKNYNPGDVIRMRVYSRGAEKDITVTLGESK